MLLSTFKMIIFTSIISTQFGFQIYRNNNFKIISHPHQYYIHILYIKGKTAYVPHAT